MADSIEKAAIDEILQTLPERIEKKYQEVIDTRAAYQTAKAEYEYQYSEIYLTLKATQPDATQGDLTASAKMGSHLKRIASIVAKSAYEKKVKEYQRLRDDLTTVEQRANNYRAELRALQG